jgi:hypothetical protein
VEWYISSSHFGRMKSGGLLSRLVFNGNELGNVFKRRTKWNQSEARAVFFKDKAS